MAAIALGAALLVALLVPGDTHPTRMGADAGFVYGYLPSVVTHGDFDFSDDSFPFDSIMPHTVEGRTGNSFPIGPAVWWSPAFLAAHGVGAVARVASHSSHPAPDGRSWPYDALVGWAAFALGVVGLWATLAAARLLASPGAALLATVGVWLGGAAVYYTHVNPMQGHVAGFAASALLLLGWLRARARPDASLWRVAALALGLSGLVVSLRRHRVVAACLLAFFAATLVLNAASYDWWGGVSFGARRFDGMWPALAVGLALLVDRVPRRAAAVAIGALIVVNGALLLAFQRGLVSVGDAVRPSDLWR